MPSLGRKRNENRFDIASLAALFLVQVEISPELKTKYLSRREQDLKDCFAALDSKEVALLERVGHQIKGNALTFGFGELATIGEEMETAARALDWNGLKAATLKFENFLKTLPR